MRISKNTQEKLQHLLKAQDYKVRYEKGNFKGGYCIVHSQRMIIINKFHPLESKINTLSEVIRDLEIDADKLTAEQQKLVKKIKQAST